MDLADYQRLTGDRQINDLAIWLDGMATGPDAATGLAPGPGQVLDRALDRVQEAIRALPGGELLDMASTGELRATSLRIFDRSFAVTGWLQAVAIAIGLFGVAASFSAQVLARRKEFGLLVHLGLTRAQVLGIVALESLAWTAIGAVAGIALGLAVAVVLVDVVNPQSFHWTMDLTVPWLRLVALGFAVIVAGGLTAWLAGRQAAGRDAVLAVKEDW
jgi:putative ABC transport system permease protein